MTSSISAGITSKKPITHALYVVGKDLYCFLAAESEWSLVVMHSITVKAYIRQLYKVAHQPRDKRQASWIL